VQYFRDLHAMIAAGQPLNEETMMAAMRPYATEPASDVR
jgi:hypothetical protein